MTTLGVSVAMSRFADPRVPRTQRKAVHQTDDEAGQETCALSVDTSA